MRLFRERDVAIPAAIEAALKSLDESGQTALLVAVDGQVAGAIGARDKVRREAHDVVHDLKHLGLRDLTILTGDRPAPARAVAKKVHLKQSRPSYPRRTRPTGSVAASTRGASWPCSAMGSTTPPRSPWPTSASRWGAWAPTSPPRPGRSS